MIYNAAAPLKWHDWFTAAFPPVVTRTTPDLLQKCSVHDPRLKCGECCIITALFCSDLIERGVYYEGV